MRERVKERERFRCHLPHSHNVGVDKRKLRGGRGGGVRRTLKKGNKKTKLGGTKNRVKVERKRKRREKDV